MAKSYTPLPALPNEVAPRYQVILEVLAGDLTVSEGARRLGLSRNHFQSLMHRGQQALLETLQGRPAGRPPVPEQERQLRDQVTRLQKENERLKQQVETTDRLLGVASGLLKGRKEHRVKASKPKSAEDE
jgi:transposase-like protein